MARYELRIPAMGEGVVEASVIKWHYNIGQKVNKDSIIVDLATDKVDNELPSPVDGVLVEILVSEGNIGQVDQIIAIIETDQISENIKIETKAENVDQNFNIPFVPIEKEVVIKNDNIGFLSPLVRSIAKEEGVSDNELMKIKGSGLEGRITKNDILNYIQSNQKNDLNKTDTKETSQQIFESPISNSKDQKIEMSRMRQLISDYMVASKKISPHVNSIIEVDMTNVIIWRVKIKEEFKKREGVNLTLTAIFVEAIAKALKEYPMINISVEDKYIIKKKDINIGMATLLPDGNLIVPVIKSADQLSLLGISKAIFDLSNRARKNLLLPNDIKEGTFTITNLGPFDTLIGTPIINQPEVAILSIGAVTKRPVVISNDGQDSIAIRSIAYLCLAYDHRVVDGALGGLFLKKIKENIEGFDVTQKI